MIGGGWCGQCGTRHAPDFSCRNLEATEPERFAWRVVVESGSKTETFGVLIARCGSLYRARVVTLPNMVWSIPGGRCSMKFVGDSADEVEAEARSFIAEVCKRRGMKMADGKPEVPSALGAEDDQTDDGQTADHLDGVRILYGIDRATLEGRTGDVSGTSLFVSTDLLIPEGRRIKLLLEMEYAKVPLEGTVIWVREHANDGSPKGMGVELHSPPALYLHFTKKLKQRSSSQQEEPEVTPV